MARKGLLELRDEMRAVARGEARPAPLPAAPTAKDIKHDGTVTGARPSFAELLLNIPEGAALHRDPWLLPG